jgi:hypothetical protein
MNEGRTFLPADQVLTHSRTLQLENAPEGAGGWQTSLVIYNILLTLYY